MNKVKYSESEFKEKKAELIDQLKRSAENQTQAIDRIESTRTKGAFEKKKTDDRTDDEILAQIKQKLEAKYGKMTEEAEKSTADQIDGIKEKIAAADEQTKNKKTLAEQAYDQATKAVENDAVKRGVQRSSIANGGIAKLNGEKLGALGKIEEEGSVKKSALEDRIQKLTDELESLKLEYAGRKISDEQTGYASEIKKRNEYNNDVTAYNNSLEEKNMKYRDKDEDLRISNEKEEVSKQFTMERLNSIVNFYRSIEDKDAALADFASDEDLRTYLGQYYTTAYRLIFNG